MATQFSLKEFTVSGCWWKDWLGGGWTPETVPTKRGWRAARCKSLHPDAVLIGRRGVKGCFSVMQYRNLLDVIFYDDLTPEEVSAGNVIGDGMFTDTTTPGWALPLIAQCEEVND